MAAGAAGPGPQAPRSRAASPQATRSSRGTGNWDVLPTTEEIVLHQRAMVGFLPKKRRELYVGNLATNQVTSEILQRTFDRLFSSLPAFHERYPDIGGPVRCVAFPTNGQGQFAFVEFYDEVIATTAVHMSGFELCGRSVKVGRPQGYIPAPFGDLPPLDVEPLRRQGLIPLVLEVLPTCTAENSAMMKQRELYFGNLTQGGVTEAIMTELLTPVCLRLPEYDPSLGPPVVKVTIASSGTYCFVKFQNADIASRAIAVFDDTELLGRRLRVGRPTTYQQCPQVPQDALPAPPSSAGPQRTDAFLAGAAAVSSFQSLQL